MYIFIIGGDKLLYIKKYYRIALTIIIPLLILLIVYLTANKHTDSVNEDLDDLLVEEVDNNSNNELMVNIKGAVVNPGVYSFSNGERVIDAIEKSGGLLENADTSVINLSKNLFDEMVIVIYTYDEVQAMKGQNVLIQYVEKECNCPKLENDACLNDNDKSSGNSIGNQNSNQTKISINTASVGELQTLSGIGSSKAQAIVDYRNQNGPFSKIEDIMNVSGIGEAVFAKIKDYITI